MLRGFRKELGQRDQLNFELTFSKANLVFWVSMVVAMKIAVGYDERIVVANSMGS